MNTILGGANVPVTLLDGSTQAIFVRQLPVKLYPKLLEAMQDELKHIDLLCDKAGLAETLAPEGHEAILNAGEKLNADFFSRWLARKQKRESLLPKPDMSEALQVFSEMQKTNPQLTEELLKRVLASPSSSPKPA
jgi:hypothetical protein